MLRRKIIIIIIYAHLFLFSYIYFIVNKEKRGRGKKLVYGTRCIRSFAYSEIERGR